MSFDRTIRTALVATSFYESGFDLVGAFEHGFRAAGGERPIARTA